VKDAVGDAVLVVVGVTVDVDVLVELSVGVGVIDGVEVIVGLDVEVLVNVTVGVGVNVGIPPGGAKPPHSWTRLFVLAIVPSSKRVPPWVRYRQLSPLAWARSPRNPPLAKVATVGDWL
jgi:hypothetical protein